MDRITSYKDLLVWEKGMEIAREAYSLTLNFPKEETYGLTSQIRRASVSVPANIAEGWGRSKAGSFLYFLRVSRGSLLELETLLLLTKDLVHVSPESLETLRTMIDEASKMLNSLISKLNAKTLN